MTEILFWKGIVSPREDLKNFEETILKLLQGEYKAANLDLKKCRGLLLYTVRVNQSDRLLFTTVKIDSKPYLLLLEVIYHHDYQKSRFLNNPVLLKQFIENTDFEQATIITESNFQDVGQEASANLLSKYRSESPLNRHDIIERPVFYFNERYLKFNNLQQQAAQATLPIIISGAPGSGKSCVALSFLASATEVLSDDNTTRKALYITRSPLLVEQMCQSWSALPASHCRDFKVDFKCYEELLLTAQPQLNKRELCGSEHFENWFTKDFIRQPQNRQQRHSIPLTPLQKLIDKKGLIYQELRVASGYVKKDYIGLGHKQSLFQEPPERAQLYELFTAYSHYLNDNNYYDPALCDLPLLTGYDLVVVDEGQDLSLQQLKNILTLAGDNLFICYDPNQSLSDAQSILPYLKEHFFKKQINVTHIDFYETYRCLADIAAMANGILDIKQQLAGRSDKQEAKAIIPAKGQNHTGEVRWLDRLDEPERTHFLEQAGHTYFAIITSEEYREEAAALFKTPLIFTPAEIKGLEYPVILIYRLIEGVDYVQASKSLHTGKHIDKRDLRPAFNALFTAFTRAQTTLFIYQPPHHPTAELIARIKEKQPKSRAGNKPLPVSLYNTSNPTDWSQEYQRQLRLGNINQANAIQQHCLSQRHDEPASAASHVVTENASKPLNDKPSTTQSNQPNKRMRRRNKSALVLKQQAPVQTPPQPIAICLNKTQENLLKNLSRKITFNFLKKTFSKDEVLKLLFERNPLDPSSGTTLFAELIVLDENFEELYNFLEKCPQFIKKLTITLLNKPSDFRQSSEERNHLFQLMMRRGGQKIVRLIFESNPDIPANLSTEMLFNIYPGFMINVFYALNLTKDGIQCLRVLLQTNKNFIEHLQSSDLFGVCLYGSKNSPIVETPFGYLSRALLANDCFLYELIKTKPELVEGTKASDLFSIYTNVTSPLETSVYLLSGSLKGIELLHIIFSKNEALAESKEINSIFKTDYRHQNNFPSAFSLLITKASGLKCLSLLFSQNGRLIQNIQADDFFRIYSFKHRDETLEPLLTSSFSLLCKRREASGLLSQILIGNSDLLNAMQFEHLLGVKSNASRIGKNFSYNNLIPLLENDHLDVIELIFKTHPEFIKRLEPLHLDLEIKYPSPNASADKTLRELLNTEALASIKALIQSIHPTLFEQKARVIYPSRLFSSITQNKDAAQEEHVTSLQPDL